MTTNKVHPWIEQERIAKRVAIDARRIIVERSKEYESVLGVPPGSEDTPEGWERICAPKFPRYQITVQLMVRKGPKNDLIYMAYSGNEGCSYSVDWGTGK